MIFHASIPADAPQLVAEVLAELWHGEAMPFPVYPDSFIAISGEGTGAEIEVVPRKFEQIPGALEVEGRRNAEQPDYSAVHVAVATKLSEADVVALAQRHQWLVRRCNRGNAFHVIEFWLENKFMIEVLTEEMQKEYLAFMNPAKFREFLQAAG